MKKIFSKIKRLYYEVWADAIEAGEKNTQSYMTNKDKMFVFLIGFSLGQGANLALLLLIIQEYLFDIKSCLPKFLSEDFWGTSIISGFLKFLLPFLILNYFLVFYKKTYLKYMENRKINTKGLALALYFIISAGVFFLYVGIKMFIAKIL